MGDWLYVDSPSGNRPGFHACRSSNVVVPLSCTQQKNEKEDDAKDVGTILEKSKDVVMVDRDKLAHKRLLVDVVPVGAQADILPNNSLPLLQITDGTIGGMVTMRHQRAV